VARASIFWAVGTWTLQPPTITTEQQNNRTTEQQNNRTTEQQNNRTTEEDNVPGFAGPQHQNGGPRPPPPCRAANAVHVLRGFGGRVVLNDPIHVGHVQPPCRHVCAEQDTRRRGAKSFEGAGPFVLVDFPVQLVQFCAHDRRQGDDLKRVEGVERVEREQTKSKRERSVQ
jgi:hypothetical protein